MPKRTRRTKAAYARLFDDPFSLFPGVKVTLFPNGEPEIWLDMGGNRGFRITAADGPAAADVTIEPLRSWTPTDVVTGSGVPTSIGTGPIDARVEVLQYKPDEWSQQFRRWCRAEANYPGDKPVGTTSSGANE